MQAPKFASESEAANQEGPRSPVLLGGPEQGATSYQKIEAHASSIECA